MKKRIRPWVKVTLILVLILSALILYSIYIETKVFKLNQYNIVNKKIPNNFNSIKVVHISDIHYKTAIKKEQLKKIVTRINNLKPDIIIISGDILDDNVKYTKKDKSILIKYLSRLDSNLGVYIIKGDNDNNKIWHEVVEKSNLIDIGNNYSYIYNYYDNPIAIYGLNSDFNDNDKKNLEMYIKDNNNYKILVFHQPDFISKLNINSFDFVLAGHSLGGNIKLPLIQNILLPEGSKKYYKDYYKIKNTEVYISNGLGTGKFIFRFYNNPSINIYTLKNK